VRLWVAPWRWYPARNIININLPTITVC